MLLWQSLVSTAARLLVMGLLIFSQTSASGMKSVNQGKHKVDTFRPFKNRRLAGAANPASLVQQGSHVTFNATLPFKYSSPQFQSVLSNDGTVLAIGFAPYSTSYPVEDSRVYVYRLSNPNTTNAKWVQTAFFTRARPSNRFLRGNVALSGDGKVLAVGAGNLAGNSSSGSLIMVYHFQSNQWVSFGSVSPSADLDYPEYFGTSLALSFNGSILAVQTYYDFRIDFFRWTGTVWRQRGALIQYVSSSFSMSQDGNVVAVRDYFFDTAIQTYRFVAGEWVEFGSSISFGNDVDTVSFTLSGNGKRIAALTFSDSFRFTSGSKSTLRVFEFDTNNNDWISVGSGVSETLFSEYYNRGADSVSLSNGGSIVAQLRGAANDECPGEVRVYQVTKNGTKNGTWPQIYKYDGPYMRSLTAYSAAISGDGKALAVADFGFETYRVVTN